MKLAAAIVCACCFAALTRTAAAGAESITLLSPNASGSPPPPLAGGQQLGSEEPGEVRVPGALSNTETVRVGLGADGRPVSVSVLQRMSIRGLGDFRFVIPAPATDVRPVAGSQSMPGLRQSGIVWQGFSPGKRLLAAQIELSPLGAGSGLPIRITVERRGGITRVRLENRTSKQFAITDGLVRAPALRSALAQVRADLGRQLVAGRPVPLTPVQVEGKAGRQVVVAVDTQVRVMGTISIADGRTANVDTTLGGGRPAVRTVQLPGKGKLGISLRASFERDRRQLLPSAADLAASPDPLRTVNVAIARAALALQYQQYLASPKPDGPSSTAYLFRTVRIAAPRPAPGGSGGSGTDTVGIVLGVLGGLVALCGLTVLWAHL